MSTIQQDPRVAPPSPSDDDEGARTTDSDKLRKVAEATTTRNGIEKLPDKSVHDALEVFLRAGGDDEHIAEPMPLKLNLRSDEDPLFVKWVVGPIDDTEITRIREQSKTKGSRAARRRGEGDIDENLVARRIVVKATLEPDIGALSKSLGTADPADAVLAYFKKFGKTGLITQISGEILGLSGWDDDDVQQMEVEAAQG